MNKQLFFNHLRDGIMGPTLDPDEVSGTEAIIDALKGLPVSWAAYALATSYHETAHSMQPVKEANWLSERAASRYFFRMYDPQGERPALARRNGNIQPGDGVKFAGRGYVQLTWRSNYERAGSKIGVDLVNNPDLAMNKDIAALILRNGMIDGWFTGKGFADYLPPRGPATAIMFTAARKIINGRDKDALIARHAMAFQAALIAGGWQ